MAKKMINASNAYGSGLGVKGGRLINRAPDGVMGITHIVNTKKAICDSKKVSIIAEGVRLGEMMSDMMEMK